MNGENQSCEITAKLLTHARLLLNDTKFNARNSLEYSCYIHDKYSGVQMHFAATVYLQKSTNSSINNSQRYTRIKETHLGQNERFSKYDYHLNEYVGDLVISRSNCLL